MNTLLAFLLLTLPAVVQAQFIFITNNGAITITGCTNSFGNSESVAVPETINGLPVVSIAYYACSYKSMTNVTIGNNVTNIGPYAFWSCSYLDHVTIPKSVASIGGSAFGACGGALGGSGIKVFFQGDKPGMAEGGILAFGVLYCLPGTIGWEGTDAVLWNPMVPTGDGSFGIQGNQFGFKITGTPDIPIVVEATASLDGLWTPLQSVSLTNGLFYFSDAQWTNSPGRFYRIRSP